MRKISFIHFAGKASDMLFHGSLFPLFVVSSVVFSPIILISRNFLESDILSLRSVLFITSQGLVLYCFSSGSFQGFPHLKHRGTSFLF